MSLKSSLMTLPKHFNQTYLYGIKNKNIVTNKLIELNEKGKTIIVVSHDADFKKIAKRNYLIEDGMLKEF